MAIRSADRVGSDGCVREVARLRSLAEELATIASALALSEQGGPGPADRADGDDLDDYARLSAQDIAQFRETARAIYRSRRLRPRIFADDSLFGEPAWDILLDLFIAEADNKPLSVTAACIGAAVPTSTALRWIAILEERGFLARENDPADARRVFLRMTGDGYAKMVSYFIAVQRDGGPGF